MYFWWPLILALVSVHTGLIKNLFLRIYILQSNDQNSLFSLIWNDVVKELEINFAIKIMTAILLGMWLGAILVSAHPSMLPKGRDYYRQHFGIFTLITVIVTLSYLNIPLRMGPITFNTYPNPWLLSLKGLFLIFSCFFLLDAQNSLGDYLRALIVLPIKLSVFNAPLMPILYAILMGMHYVPLLINSYLFIPFFFVICSILYRITVNNNYNDYYGENA